MYILPKYGKKLLITENADNKIRRYRELTEQLQVETAPSITGYEHDDVIYIEDVVLPRKILILDCPEHFKCDDVNDILFFIEDKIYKPKKNVVERIRAKFIGRKLRRSKLYVYDGDVKSASLENLPEDIEMISSKINTLALKRYFERIDNEIGTIHSHIEESILSSRDIITCEYYIEKNGADYFITILCTPENMEIYYVDRDVVKNAKTLIEEWVYGGILKRLKFDDVWKDFVNELRKNNMFISQ